MIYNKTKLNKKSAFSLVEVLISLVLISLVMVAMAPVITKKISDKTTELNVEMRTDIMLDEVVVEPKKEKYSRKNNPAVELMKKVINAKKASDLSLNDYYRYTKYQKITFSLNNITVDSINESKLFKKYPFLKDQVEVCNVTGKNILTISVDEKVT